MEIINETPNTKSDIKEYRCNICDKPYVNKNSKYRHQLKCSKKKEEVEDLEKVSNEYSCIYCGKKYLNKNSKYKHQLKCENKSDMKKIMVEIDKIKDKQNKNSSKMINSNNITTNNITTNNNNHGTIINNKIIINNIGKENLFELTDQEITTIFNKEIESILTFIELINFNERLPHNHSYCTTSLESKYLSTYDTKTKKIYKDRKKYFFDNLLNSSIERIEILYNGNKNKFNKIKRKEIEDNISNLKLLKSYNFNSRTIREIMNKMNLISYNNRDKVLNTWNRIDNDDNDNFQDDLDKGLDDNLMIQNNNKNNYEDSSDYDSDTSDDCITKRRKEKEIIV
jgi:hypothetical protein